MAPSITISQPGLGRPATGHAVVDSCRALTQSATCQAAGLHCQAYRASAQCGGVAQGGRQAAELSQSWQLSQAGSLRLAQRPKATGRPVRVHVASGATVSATAKPHTDSFENVKTEEDLLAAIQREVEAKKLPAKAAPGMGLFWQNYRDAVVSSGAEGAEELALKVMATVFDRIMVQFEDPFTFPSYHTRITEPYDYYMFGQNYIQPLLDYKNSYVGNLALLDDIERQLNQGHNVVLLANHQTEADPAVLALLLETTHPRLATSLTYVAGDRVVLDPFCKPFSMGRNLLCVFSKKRLHDVPALVEQKMAANRRTLKEMALLFRKGGNLIWIAPSGGRDRPDPVTDEWVPAAFDSSSVDLMRRLLHDAGVPGHLYPMALLCYDIMPPPKKVEKELGEVRVIGHHGVATSVGAPISFEAVAADIEDRKEAREALSKAAFESVVAQYNILKEAVHGGKGLAAATPDLTLAQPWLCPPTHAAPDLVPQSVQPAATATAAAL